MIQVRDEQLEDIPAIRSVHQAAFPGPGEARLVDLLRQAGKASISLVAEFDGVVAGHILFSPVTAGREEANLLSSEPARVDRKGLGLAPVAVLPEYQSQGIGSALIRAGLEMCRKCGFEFVVVLGAPRYYSRFGFRPASRFGLENEYGVDEEFMAQELTPGGLSGVKGLVKYQPEFSVVS
jgi:putative acetyltransferase